MNKSSEESIKKELINEIMTYCKKLKKYAQENNIDLSNICIGKRWK